jgi:hypothetical protein
MSVADEHAQDRRPASVALAISSGPAGRPRPRASASSAERSVVGQLPVAAQTSAGRRCSRCSRRYALGLGAEPLPVRPHRHTRQYHDRLRRRWSSSKFGVHRIARLSLLDEPDQPADPPPGEFQHGERDVDPPLVAGDRLRPGAAAARRSLGMARLVPSSAAAICCACLHARRSAVTRSPSSFASWRRRMSRSKRLASSSSSRTEPTANQPGARQQRSGLLQGLSVCPRARRIRRTSRRPLRVRAARRSCRDSCRPRPREGACL